MDNESIGSWSAMPLSADTIVLLQQYYSQAEKIGTATATYLYLLIKNARMEKRMVDGCRALLRLSRVYGSLRLEAACTRALQGNKYNYTIIKNILINHLESAELIIASENENRPAKNHENLRGQHFFE